MNYLKAVSHGRKNGVRTTNDAASDAAILRDALGDALPSLRFGAMDTNELTVILSSELHRNLISQEILGDIMQKQIDPTFESELFQSHARSPVVNRSTSLTFTRSFDVLPNYFIRNVESTWFSTNQRAILGSINLCNLKNADNSVESFNVAVEVLEYDTNIISAEAAHKVLTKLQSTGETNSEICLTINSALIVIQPLKMYEIRVAFREEDRRRFAHVYEWSPEELQNHIPMSQSHSIKMHSRT